MAYDFDRFEDALRTRATNFTEKDPNPYMVGYMTSLLKELYGRYPETADRIDNSTKFLEDLIRHDKVYGYTEDDMISVDKPL